MENRDVREEQLGIRVFAQQADSGPRDFVAHQLLPHPFEVGRATRSVVLIELDRDGFRRAQLVPRFGQWRGGAFQRFVNGFIVGTIVAMGSSNCVVFSHCAVSPRSNVSGNDFSNST